MLTLPACRVYVGTDDGLFTFDVDGEQVDRVGRSLAGETVRDVSVHPGDPDVAAVGCGLRGWGLHRVTDAGDRARTVGFADEWVWGVTRDPADPDAVYVGTEPPGLFHGRPGGDDGFETVSDFATLPTREDWSFGHDPFAAGHVHGITVADATLLAAVEHGAVLFSRDGGETWEDALPGIDAHDTALVEGRFVVTAGTAGDAAGGLLWSEDATEWHRIDRFDGMYVKELVQSADGRLFVDAAPDPTADTAGVWNSDDGGRTWTSVGAVPPASVVGCNLLSTHPTDARTLFHATHYAGEAQLVVSTDRGATWAEVGPQLPTIRSVDAAPLP
ncbi:WD40/YVTN/BNR-like repeat-containing protein [Haloarchaeobius amylolyticus]|uniref:WD40/YVTN/BNR-like repeat-containing protein n=1 Tax=Haloarchaeobius amylolyticus TaxID=1198296 RepID=UPI00227119F0|nr:sialidase family protein [Haloarchaeobius amylolyticus]